MLKIDLHLHTNYSDGDLVDNIVKMAKFKRLDGLAITDHYTLEGYRVLRKLDDKLLILPGVEVETKIAHILLIGIDDSPFRRIRSYVEVMEWARDNNAITILAHPMATFLSIKRNIKLINRYKPDAVEVCNSLYPFFVLAKRFSEKIAENLSLPMTGGSDAHRAIDVGNCYTLIDAEPNIDDVLESIRKGKIKAKGKPSNIFYRTKIGLYFLFSLIENNT